MRTITKMTLNLVTGQVTYDSIVMNAENKEQMEQETCLVSTYSEYFEKGKPWRIPVVACSYIKIDKNNSEYIEYCDNTVPQFTHEHERMHLFDVLADAYCNHDAHLKTEMLVSFMTNLKSNRWNESFEIYQKYQMIDKNSIRILTFLKKAYEILQMFPK